MIEDKQIDEMAKLVCTFPQCINYNIIGGCKASKCNIADKAEAIYIAGYRKQKEGEWIAKDNFNGRCTIATCSNCGTEKAFAVLVSIDTIATLYPYCQKCGARMKGGAE